MEISMSFISFLLGFADQTAATGEAPKAGPLGMLGSILPLLLIIVIFYFFMIRPQNKKQKETEKMLNALKKGDKVVTIGGIHGVVSSVKENTVIVKVDDGCKIEFNRSAISTVLKSEAELAKEKEEASKKKGLFGGLFGKKKDKAEAAPAEKEAKKAEETNAEVNNSEDAAAADSSSDENK